MKKGPRCPVCGSPNIKEFAERNPAGKSSTVKKEGDASTGGSVGPCGEQKWRCGDCYRKFETPDEQTK